MLVKSRFTIALAACVALAAASVQAAGLTDGMKKGAVELKSAGPLAFGPEGILFVGDPKAAALVAIDTQDRTAGSAGGVNVAGLDGKIAARLGVDAKQVQIVDMAVNPLSSTVYLSVSRGQGPQAMPVLLRVDASGKIDEVSLKDVNSSQATLINAPPEGAKNARGQSPRMESITDLAFIDGRVIVAGLSNEDFSSNLRAVPFPFKDVNAGATVEIYHGAHGKLETQAPVRTFAIYSINQEPHVLAAYTCTPLVKFPLSDLKTGAKIKGVTIAELGNRNKPLDMIIYSKDGKDYVLTANSARGVMKITTEKIDTQPSINEKVSDKAGLTYETIESLKGVEQLDKLNKEQAVILVRAGDALNLQTIALP
jgi:hypothetical protein